MVGEARLFDDPRGAARLSVSSARHDLRHTGAVLAAQTGATLAELMGHAGHSTPGAAMRYQHAAADRDAEIGRRLSDLAATMEDHGSRSS